MWCVYFGMPMVTAYHLLISNVFINTAAQDATGFEKAGNLLLTPVHYLLAGKIALNENGQYRLVQRFDYNHNLALKSTLSLVSAPLSFPVGCLFKSIGYFSQQVRDRHRNITIAACSKKVHPNIELYKKLGIPLSATQEAINSSQFQRRPGDEKNLSLEKQLLKEIVRIFNENQIPYWVDAGTCLGAYRYGGVIPWDEDVDVAILMPDFQNAFNALKELDPEKYQVQDWSNRCHPETYIRVFVKENRSHVDIYHHTIDSGNRTLTYFVSCIDSNFMTTGWKTREARFTTPTSYDTVFPLRKVQFDGIEVCVPHQTKLYLQEKYGENIDPAKIYNENTGEYEKDLTHPYWQRSHVH
jgi:hypothetical protein